MIKCKQCNKELDESNFYRLYDGYRQPCKQCRTENAKIKYVSITEKKLNWNKLNNKPKWIKE